MPDKEIDAPEATGEESSPAAHLCVSCGMRPVRRQGGKCGKCFGGVAAPAVSDATPRQDSEHRRRLMEELRRRLAEHNNEADAPPRRGRGM